ncbi:MAG: TatD family hydrolase [Bacteroidia bacterium]
MMFTDTHTHFYAEEFDADREQLLKNALELGIRRFYLPNVDSGSIARMLELEKDHPEYFHATMGLHPCSVKENYKAELDIIEEWLSKRSFKAVGEIGIDLYWDKTFMEEQKYCFRRQIELALQYKLPIVIHCREAFDEIYAVLQEYESLPHGIFHCFSGTLEQAQKVIDLGFKLGIGGVVTFKNSGLDKVVEQLDLKHLVLETDAPYLAPAPFRGKRNEPAYLYNVAKKIAELKNCSLEEVAGITNANADLIFEQIPH